MQQKFVSSYLDFSFFTINTWQYDSSYSDRVLSIMSNEEKEEFQIDVTTIDWNIVIKDFLFGIRRFYFREDVLQPESLFK